MQDNERVGLTEAGARALRSMRRQYRIAVTVRTPRGEAGLSVLVEAVDARAAKFEALRHCSRIGYEHARLGFPRRPPLRVADSAQQGLFAVRR